MTNFQTLQSLFPDSFHHHTTQLDWGCIVFFHKTGARLYVDDRVTLSRVPDKYFIDFVGRIVTTSGTQQGSILQGSRDVKYIKLVPGTDQYRADCLGHRSNDSVHFLKVSSGGGMSVDFFKNSPAMPGPEFSIKC